MISTAPSSLPMKRGYGLPPLLQTGGSELFGRCADLAVATAPPGGWMFKRGPLRRSSRGLFLGTHEHGDGAPPADGGARMSLRTPSAVGAGRFPWGSFPVFSDFSDFPAFPGLFGVFRGFSGPCVRFSFFHSFPCPVPSAAWAFRVLPGLLWAFSSSRASRGFRLIPPFAFFSGFFFSFPSVAALVVLPRFLARLIFLQGGHGISPVSGPRKGL